MISVLIPVYNEESTIQSLLEMLNKLKESFKLEIIIINDGSTDETFSILSKNYNLYDVCINLKKNLGKGKAIIEGLKKCSGKLVYFQDADLEYEPDNLKLLAGIYEKNNADLIMGSRFTSSTRSTLHFWHTIGNKFVTFCFNLINNTSFTDIYCCNILFNKKSLDTRLSSYGWGQQAEILTHLVNNSKKIYEVGVNYNARNYNEGKKIRYYHVFQVIYWIIYTKLKIKFYDLNN